jgi:hypothetical protein
MKMICSKPFRSCATSLLSTSAAVFLVLALAAFSVRSVAAEGDDEQAYVISASNQFGIVNVETGAFSLIGNTTSTLSGLGAIYPHSQRIPRSSVATKSDDPARRPYSLIEKGNKHVTERFLPTNASSR